MYRTSRDNVHSPPHPAVFVAEATTSERARELRRRLWNTGDCPFLVVLLPGTVRVYAGFDCPRPPELDRPLVEVDRPVLVGELSGALRLFHAEEINSGAIWADQSQYLDAATQVDYRLLRSLRGLSRLLQLCLTPEAETHITPAPRP